LASTLKLALPNTEDVPLARTSALIEKPEVAVLDPHVSKTM
jgi:hypothetical protein